MKFSLLIVIVSLLTLSLTRVEPVQVLERAHLPMSLPAALLSAEQTALLFAPGGLQEILMRRYLSNDSLKAECYVSFRAVDTAEINWNQGKRLVTQDIIRQLLDSGRMGQFANQFSQYLERQSPITVSEDVRFVSRSLVQNFK